MTQEPLPPLPHTGIVTVDELHRYMGFPQWNQRQKLNAADTLAGVQQELENHLNRPIEPVQIRQTVVSDPQGYLNLSITPVHKIISCTSLDLRYNAAPLYTPTIEPPAVMERNVLVGDHGRLLDMYRPGVGDPFIVAGGCEIGTVGMPYLIEYIAGYNGYVNLGLKNAIKRVAAREIAPNADQAVSLREGNVEALKDPDDRPRGWTTEELEKWDRLRRRVMA